MSNQTTSRQVCHGVCEIALFTAGVKTKKEELFFINYFKNVGYSYN